MIVVDTNVIASLFLRRPDSAACRAAVEADRAWVVPPLWRSELLSVLRYECRLATPNLSEQAALAVYDDALRFFAPVERRPDPARVLALTSKKLSSYDAEFLALAEECGAIVVSNDPAFLKVAGARARSP